MYFIFLYFLNYWIYDFFTWTKLGVCYLHGSDDKAIKVKNLQTFHNHSQYNYFKKLHEMSTKMILQTFCFLL